MQNYFLSADIPTPLRVALLNWNNGTKTVFWRAENEGNMAIVWCVGSAFACKVIKEENVDNLGV
jgi:hypothetical protein